MDTATYQRKIIMWPVGDVFDSREASIVYRASDPSNVHLTLPHNDGRPAATFTFPREHMLDGLEEAHYGCVILPLTVDGQQVEFLADAVPLRPFLANAPALAEFSQEINHLDMDTLAARLLEVTA